MYEFVIDQKSSKGRHPCLGTPCGQKNPSHQDDMMDARYIGAERVAAEAAEARGEGPMEAPQPLTADEAIAAAAAEDLVLARKDGTPFGFWGVSKSGHKFKASVRGLPGAGAKSKSNPITLGTFASPEEAALALARKYPTAAARLVEMEAVKQAVKSAKPAVGMTEEEVRQAARPESADSKETEDPLLWRWGRRWRRRQGGAEQGVETRHRLRVCLPLELGRVEHCKREEQ